MINTSVWCSIILSMFILIKIIEILSTVRSERMTGRGVCVSCMCSEVDVYAGYMCVSCYFFPFVRFPLLLVPPCWTSRLGFFKEIVHLLSPGILAGSDQCRQTVVLCKGIGLSSGKITGTSWVHLQSLILLHGLLVLLLAPPSHTFSSGIFSFVWFRL